MPLAPWVGAYVGLPYQAQGRTRAGSDCYGLMRLVLADIYGITIPAYDSGYDLDKGRAGWPEVSEAITVGLTEWTPVERADVRIGDGVVFRIAGRPLHIGLIVGTGPLRFLHQEEKLDSVIEPVDSVVWQRRLSGFYRWTRA